MQYLNIKGKYTGEFDLDFTMVIKPVLYMVHTTHSSNCSHQHCTHVSPPEIGN